MKSLKLLVLVPFLLLLNNCESKASKCAENETNRCIAEELNKLEKPFLTETIDHVRRECGTYVNEIMQDMQQRAGE